MSFEWEVRGRLHVGDAPPAGVCELVFAPAFHDALALRIAGARVEIWMADTCSVLEVPALLAFENELSTLPHCATERGGRDGLALFVPSALGEGTYSTVEGESLWLHIAARVVDAMLGAQALDHASRVALLAIAWYLGSARVESSG